MNSSVFCTQFFFLFFIIRDYVIKLLTEFDPKYITLYLICADLQGLNRNLTLDISQTCSASGNVSMDSSVGNCASESALDLI